ncbi:hypothetical protein BU24DRAFT_416232 [Aaosphaeria arxii CBS 175.79]|uniref:Prion-inhibition and propagation HeLo domain-containing protein n=1 Tax=Aaosphaeria arxii CBS 175.79 TaxID=1450172 RepID=A0A6A5Y4S8_9PLEO|nr:uncharacterized protein BU24DRAFT_416232 [Aaosphaeria arxii CBS 175.79]KAF2020562.1 hypothetical protein BU24DRAFT_416232 [Aaosphaeria arxii CBS 175.79]
MRQLFIKRQNRSGVLQRAKWALYLKKQWGQLIEEITELVDSLVEPFPATHSSQREICEMVISAMEKDGGISGLREIAAAQDKFLEQAIAKTTDGVNKSYHIVFSSSGNTDF